MVDGFQEKHYLTPPYHFFHNAKDFLIAYRNSYQAVAAVDPTHVLHNIATILVLQCNGTRAAFYIKTSRL